MNEPNEKIEQMLGRLELQQPSASLDQRMSDLFAQSGSGVAGRIDGGSILDRDQDQWASYKFKLRLSWSLNAVAGIAAVLAVAWMVGQNMNTSPSTPSTVQSAHVVPPPTDRGPASAIARNSVNPLVGPQLAEANMQVGESRIVDEGFTTTPAGDPVRVLRRESVQRSMWVDPDTQAHVQVEVPNEEVVLINSPTY